MSIDIQSQLENDGWEIYEFKGPWRLLDDFNVEVTVSHLNTFLQNPKLFQHVIIDEHPMPEILSLWSQRAHRSRWYTVMSLLQDFHAQKDIEHLMLCYAYTGQTSSVYMGQTRLSTFHLMNDTDFEIQKALIFKNHNQQVPSEIMNHSHKVTVDYIENELQYDLDYKEIPHFYKGGPMVFAKHIDRDFDQWDKKKFKECGGRMRQFFKEQSTQRIMFTNPEVHNFIIHDYFTRDSNKATWSIDVLHNDVEYVFKTGYLAYALMLCVLDIEHSNGIVSTTKLRESV